MLIKRLLILALATGALAACNQDPAPAEQPTTTTKAPTNTRFTLVDGASSGITFKNEITENHQLNIITNSYMYNGCGVTVIDVNNDGLQDLYFGSAQGANTLYLNKGDFQFEDITETAGVAALGGFKTGASAVDINQDGYTDLYVCRTGLQATEDRRNLLYINQGDNTFWEAAQAYGLDAIAGSNQANFFDYDLDGDLDMYLMNHPVDFKSVNNVNLVNMPNGEQVRNSKPRAEYESDQFFRNDGNGQFTDVSQQAGIVNRAFGLSVTVSDFNEDGYPDVFVGNDYIEPDILYINNKNGTFTDRIEDYFKHTSNHTMGVDIADFNNDNKVDVAALDMIAEDNRRQKLLMTTMINQRYNTLVKYGYGHQMMRNVLQLNQGEGNFSEIGTLSGISNTDWSWSVLMADLDNDGWKDMYITNGYRRDVSNLDYLTYTVDSINRTGGITQSRFPDFNDFLNMIPSERLQNYAFHNNRNLTFSKVSTDWGFVQESFSNGSAYADLDNDGDLDLIINNIADPAFVYKNNSREREQNHYVQFSFKGAGGNPQGVGARVWLTLADGSQQYQENYPVRGFFSSVAPLVHFGLGDQTTVQEAKIVWPNGNMQVMENLEADQRYEVSVENAKQTYQPTKENTQALFKAASQALNFRHQENDFEDFDRERLLPHRLSKLGPYLATADLNGDQLTDLFVGGAAGQAGAIFLQQSNGRFSQKPQAALDGHAAQEDLGAIFLDADGDQDMDLYVVSGGNAFPLNDDRYQDRLYLNDGKGNFSYAPDALPKMTTSGACVEAFDYDGDGDQDLFVGGRVSPGAYPQAPQSFVLQNGGQGTFTDVTKQVAPAFQTLGMITDIQFADLNGDQATEMVVSGEWMPITIFSLQNGAMTNVTEQYGMAKTGGWWNCVQLADIDQDGDMDILAGNLGENSRLQASEGQPLRLYQADFDRNGSLDPIITYFNQGKEYPLARLESILKQVPGVKKRFVYFEPYSSATISEVFDQRSLDNAVVYEVQEFSSMYYENLGNGRFQGKELPRRAQFAPINQFLIDDVNGDGHLDVLMVGNNYSAEVESGRYDASYGLVLAGDGQGGFRPMSNANTGFWVSGDAKDIRKLNTKSGKSLYVITNNDGKIDLLER